MSRWTAWQGRWRAELTDELEALRDWPWFETLRTLRLRFREDRLGLTAGSLTFTTLISLVPLLTVMLAVFAAFPMFGNFQRALETYFLQALVPDEIARPALKTLTQFAANAKRIGGVGALMLGVTALAMMLTIDRTLNTLWRVPKPRPIAQRVLVYWAALTLGPLLVGVSLSVSSYALSASRGWVQGLPGGVSLLLDVAEFGLMALAMAGLFHHVPNTWVRWRHALAGGVFVAIAFELAKAGLAWYVAAVPNFAAVYGTFATLPILLLWIYLGWVIVLMGAVIAAYAPSLKMGVARRRADARTSLRDGAGHRARAGGRARRVAARPERRRHRHHAAHRPAADRAGAGDADRARLGRRASTRRAAPAWCCCATRRPRRSRRWPMRCC